VIITLVMLVISMAIVIGPPTVVGSIIWVTPVIAVIAARVVAVSVCGITEADSDSSDPN
jgi:hypothetical protein